MSLRLWITTISSAGHLALALIAFSSARRTRLATTVGLSSLALAGWLFAQLMHRRTHYVRWDHVAQACSVLSVVFGTYVVFGFVGRERRYRPLLAVLWLWAIPLALASLLEPYLPIVRGWPGSFSWAVVIGAFGLGWMGFAMATLVSHWRAQIDRDERSRTALLFGALAINTASALLELTKSLGLPRPDLGHLGTLAGTMLTAAVVLQAAPSTGSRPSITEGAAAAAIGATAVAGFHAIFSIAGHDSAILALALASFSILVFGALQRVGAVRAERLAREQRHVWLGRMAEQLAHDLKNPLAAVRGAVELIEHQLASRGTIDASNDFVPMLRPQLARIDAVVERYLRTANVEPSPCPDAIGPIVVGVVEILARDAGRTGQVRVDVEPMLPEVSIDRELVQSALENLVRNALEVTRERGELSVTARLGGDRDLPRAVVVAVDDTGPGMDARVLARAGEVFFTTKPQGTGLGLSFARRVAAAHGGKLVIESRLGRGTTVNLLLPVT